jgi:hypothetical protein
MVERIAWVISTGCNSALLKRAKTEPMLVSMRFSTLSRKLN